MLIKRAIFLAAAFQPRHAGAALAGGWTDPAGYAVQARPEPKPVSTRARIRITRAPTEAMLWPVGNRKGAASRPRSGCTNVYNYDRALDGYSYDLVCNGIDLSPH